MCALVLVFLILGLVQLCDDDSKYLADCEAGLNWKSDVDLMVLSYFQG